jgi:hypothetical protein
VDELQFEPMRRVARHLKDGRLVELVPGNHDVPISW